MSATYIRSGVNGHFPELFLLDFEPIEVHYHHVRSNFTSRDTRALAQQCTVVGPTRRTAIFAPSKLKQMQSTLELWRWPCMMAANKVLVQCK